MFAFLRGTVAFKGLQSIALDVGGVGYELFVPDFVHEKLSMNREVTLLTYCHIREESFQIFGFLRQDEKALFELLLSISPVRQERDAVAQNVKARTLQSLYLQIHAYKSCPSRHQPSTRIEWH